jgi:hypothetical protein
MFRSPLLAASAAILLLAVYLGVAYHSAAYALAAILLAGIVFLLAFMARRQPR